MKSNYKMRTRLLVVLVVFLALCLRLPGISWGLPDETHLWPYHPDESLVLTSLAKMKPLEGNFNPGIPAGGHAFVYATAFKLGLAHLAGIVHLTPDHEFYRANPDALRRIYLLQRFAGIGWDLLGILGVALVGSRLGGPKAGFWAGTIAAVNPGRVYLSHFSTYYVPGMALSALACYFFLTKKPSLKILLAASAITGVAAGMVYIAAIPLLLGVIKLIRDLNGRGLLVVAAGFTAGLALSSPYFFLDLSLTFSGFERIRDHYLSNAGASAPITSSSWLTILSAAVGWPMLLFGGAGLLLMTVLSKDRPFNRLFVFYGILSLIIFALIRSEFARHYSPLFPIIEASAGFCAAKLSSRFGKALAILILTASVFHSMAHNTSFIRPDPRDTSRQWVESNFPPGTKFIGINWYFAPHLDIRKYPTTMLWSDFPDLLDDEKHDYLILSDCEVDLALWSKDPRYKMTVYFSDDLPVWTKHFIRPSDPVDLRYSRPGIALYKRDWNL